jgi:beta-phosphoglucomutase-like phosphatase (HAD superfamily)
MIKAVIFDFDQTIVDSSKIEYLRNNRDWTLIRSKLNLIALMEHFRDLYNLLKENNLKLCIISHSPREKYIKHILNHYNLQFDLILGYEDLDGFLKPNSYIFKKAVRKLLLDENSIISIGDHKNDIIASKNAGINAIYYSSKPTDAPYIYYSNDYLLIIEFIKSMCHNL